ncbi:MAG: hypothetical protein AAGI45_08865 [Cyanobacteria bacterium P01_H01_bin.26]
MVIKAQRLLRSQQLCDSRSTQLSRRCSSRFRGEWMPWAMWLML